MEANVEIPLRDDGYPAYSVTSALEGVTYIFTLQWNEREDHWYLSVADREGDPIISGVKIVTDWPLWRRATDTRLPPGQLFAVDSDGTGDPNLTDLGNRVKLVYMPDV